jgi:phage terminase large subunit-like protein
MVPLPIQRAFIASTARQKFLMGGQRSSKSEAGVCDLVLDLLGIKGLVYPGFRADGTGVNGWAVALSSLKWRDTLQPKIEKMLGGSYRRGGFIKRFYEADALYLLTNDRTCQLMSCEAGFEKFQSVAIGKALCDEVPPESIYKQLVVRTAEQQGSVAVAATPTRGTGWAGGDIYDEWVEGTNGEPREHKGKIFFFMDTEENRYVPPSVVDDLKSTYRDPDELAMAKSGRFVSLSGLVFKMFDFKKHVYDPLEKFPKGIQREFPRYRGFDWGIRSPSPCVWVAEDPAERIFYAYREIYRSGISVPALSREVIQASGEERITGDFLDPSCWNRKGADEAGAWLDTAQEYINAGIPVMKGNNAWHQGIQRMQTLLQEGRLLISRECPNLIREIRRYSWPEMRQNASGELVQAPESRSKNHDHALDALRYVLMATPDYEDTGKQGGMHDGKGTGFRGDTADDEFRRHMAVEVRHVDGKLLTVAVVRKGPAPDEGLKVVGGTGLR